MKVLSNTLASNPNQTYIVLNCEVVAMKKGDSSKFVAGRNRKVSLFTTPATIEKTKSFLKYAQFPEGRSVGTLAADHPDHYSLAGVEFDATNNPQASEKDGKTYDNFSALPVGNKGGNSNWMEKLEKPTTSAVSKLDDLFGVALKPRQVSQDPQGNQAKKPRW